MLWGLRDQAIKRCSRAPVVHCWLWHDWYGPYRITQAHDFEGIFVGMFPYVDADLL